MNRDRGRYVVLGAVALLVGYYYLWQARTADGPFAWRGDKNGFYNLLARGFLSGHLYTPVQPSPELLALPNPWDPHVDDRLRWQDMVLYGGRYYLYFGAAPAALLFAPWRAATGQDLPENFAACVLLFGGFLFGCGALLRVLALTGTRPPWWLLSFLFLALGICQSAPFLLNRAAVYEVAIASGYCCAMGGLFFLARGNHGAAGLIFGLAVASRPHLVLVGAVALAALMVYCVRRGSRGFIRFAAAWAAIGVCIAIYNYQRFGNPLEFGFQYQLAGPGQNRVEVAARNVKPGVYYMLLARPDFSPVFPWIRMAFRFPFDSAERNPLPPDYFVEPTAGALWIAPFALLALLGAGSAKDEARLVARTALWGSAAILAFLVSTHLMTQRYEVDFLPLAVFAAAAAVALGRRRWVAAVACVLIAYSAAANLALALAGPYDDHLRNRPASWLKLARRFSTDPEHRPVMAPRIDVRLEAQFPENRYREPIVTVGRSHYCWFLYAEWTASGIRLVSKTNESQMEYDLGKPAGAVPIRARYEPETGDMRVEAAGRAAIVHRVGMLITAPSQVAIGENDADMGLTARRFTGSLRVIGKTVEGGR